MAQRLIHLLLADMIINSGSGEYIGSPERFRFGNLLPDAYREEDQGGTARRDANIRTHFRSATPDMEYRYFDFSVFYRKYPRLIKTDDMYLGYYIHLVEDAYYRYYSYIERGLPRRTSPEQVTAMHSDYRKLNAYIVSRYGVDRAPEKPAGFKTERINELYPFDPDRLLRELREDLTDRRDGGAKILTEGFLEGFIEGYAERCIDVVRRVKEGEGLPEPLDWKWSAGDHKEYL